MLARSLAVLALLAAPALGDQHEEIVVSHGYSNFGELKYGPDEVWSYVNTDAPKGGEISFATLATFDSFNPYSRKGVVESTAADVIYERIFVSAADDPYAVYCYLCTTIEYPAESLDWVVINLREDVTFSDGRPMTAEDLKFTADLFLEQGIVEFRNIVDGFFKSIEVTGPYQLRFEFEPTSSRRDRMGIAGLWVAFSKEWFEETGTRLDEAADRPFLGTGPYVLGDVDLGRSVTYERSPDWWGADLTKNTGLYNFDRIRVEAFLDQTAALEAFKVGEYTFRTPGSAQEWATSYDFPAVQRGWVVTESLPDGNIGSARGMAFNLRRDEWQDPRVRRAVELMFNFEWSNDTLFYGLYDRPYSFWGGSELAAEGLPTEGERAILEPLVEQGLIDAAVLEEEAVIPPANDAASNAPSRAVRREATRLLEEAGYTTGPAGLLRNEAGEVLDLTIIQFDANLDRVMNPFVENLRAIGIDARLQRTDTSTYVELRRSGDWDLTNILPGQGFEPSLGLKQWFGSETAENSSRNIMALADPGIDALIDLVIASDNLDDLRDRTRALDRVLRAYGFWLSQWEAPEVWVAYWDQYGRPDPLPPLSIGVISFWWYDAEKAEALREAGAL
jgi:microcin C transport system substrate-binding protein